MASLLGIVVVRFAINIAAAMNPDEHGVALVASVARSDIGREDIQIQTIFVDIRRACEHTELRDLGTGVGKLRRL